jgi:hypothetical protein
VAQMLADVWLKLVPLTVAGRILADV